MNKLMKASLLTAILIQILGAEDIQVIDTLEKMFTNASVSGEVRFISAGYTLKEAGATSNYASAVGGLLKYELAPLHGINAAVAFRTSQDIGLITGDKADNRHNNELSSTAGNYTDLTQSYINYNYKNLNIRAGRQVIDTPLANSDDWSMISNSFEAYIVTYNYSNFSFMVGNLQNWQGVDAGLDNSWLSHGENGTYLAGVTYSQAFDMSAWYYDISVQGEETKAIYLDASYNYVLNKKISLNSSLQYINQSEVNNSGVEAKIYGALAELAVYDTTINVAYNKSLKNIGKRSFSGFGGGALYTSMNIMILDAIAQDREADVLMAMLNYNLFGADIYYAYANFIGGKNSLGNEEHIAEHDIGVNYVLNDNFEFVSVYVIEEDLKSSVKTSNDWERFQVMLRYTF